MTAIRAITFDIGGTLIAPHPSVGTIYAELLAEAGVEAEPALLDARFGEAFRRVSQKLPSSDRAFWVAVVRETCAPLEMAEETFVKVFERAFATFAEGRRWRVFEEAETVLATLRARGFRLAALSNADARFHAVLGDLGLKRYFERVFLSGEVGFEKPDTRIFRAVEGAMGLAPETFLHVGDSAGADAAGAHAAGWQARLVDPLREPLRALLDDPRLAGSLADASGLPAGSAPLA